jgi:hypothetical protein
MHPPQHPQLGQKSKFVGPVSVPPAARTCSFGDVAGGEDEQLK